MDKQKVYVVGLQFAQAFVDRFGGFFLACVRNPDFCNKENVFAVDTRFRNCCANAFLVVIRLCGVYQSITN